MKNLMYLLLLLLLNPEPLQARIHRNPAVRHAFMRMTGYPNGHPGYIIDHVIPLECGGCDCVENMQWQDKTAAHLKDLTESNCTYYQSISHPTPLGRLPNSP